MTRLLEIALLLAAATTLAACAQTQARMTLGDIPRDTRGQPVWSEVMKKASAGALTSGTGRDVPIGAR